jgi:GDPmannose 4,6-dehydratase
MTRALILGANGQDGSYLCDILCARHYDVVGAGLQPSARWPVPAGAYHYQRCDVADQEALVALLREVAPDIVFHFAAIHGPAGFNYEAVWQKLHQVNTLSAHCVLEYIRAENPDCGVVYASSAKVFGTLPPSIIDERAPRLSTDLYSITKNTAHSLVDYYRDRHGVRASVLYLFNHESPRRTPDYFIPRIAQALNGGLSGGGKGEIHTLDFACDWGDAREYMEIAADIAERAIGEDYILATGKTWTGREMVSQLFARHGLDYSQHLTETSPGAGVQELYQANTSKLKATLGRAPKRSILDVFDDFLQGAS